MMATTTSAPLTTLLSRTGFEVSQFTSSVITTRENHLNYDVTTYQPISDNLSSGLTNETGLFNNTDDYAYYDVDHIPDYPKDAQMGFLVILFILIVGGNSVVLAAIALSPERRRSRMNFFILNLAIADLLNGPFNVLIDILVKITEYWYAGDVMCRMIQYIRVVVICASTFMLVSLSIDRLDAVARPMSFHGSFVSQNLSVVSFGGTRARVLIATSWILSFLFAIPELFVFKEMWQMGGLQCYIELPEPWHWKLYITMFALVLFIVPAIIICLCYVYIIALIWRSMRLQTSEPSVYRKSKRRSKDEVMLNGNTVASSSDSCSSSRGVIPQAKIRTIKMTFIIVLVFIMCWSPYFIFNLCQVYGHVPWNTTTMKVTIFVQSLAPLNSAANPVIYGIFSTRICRYLRRVYMFRKLSDNICKCCQVESPRPTSATEYTSMTETEDIRMTSDVGNARVTRVPYVRQPLTDADKDILQLHVTSRSADKGDILELHADSKEI